MGSDSNVSDDETAVDERKVGEIALLDLSDKELDDVLDLVCKDMDSDIVDLLYNIVGKEKILLYLEVMEGLTVKYPQRKTLEKIINNVRIYNYVEARNCTEDSYVRASKIYGKRTVAIRRIVAKMKEVLNKVHERI